LSRILRLEGDSIEGSSRAEEGTLGTFQTAPETMNLASMDEEVEALSISDIPQNVRLFSSQQRVQRDVGRESEQSSQSTQPYGARLLSLRSENEALASSLTVGRESQSTNIFSKRVRKEQQNDDVFYHQVTDISTGISPGVVYYMVGDNLVRSIS